LPIPQHEVLGKMMRDLSLVPPNGGTAGSSPTKCRVIGQTIVSSPAREAGRLRIQFSIVRLKPDSASFLRIAIWVKDDSQSRRTAGRLPVAQHEEVIS
jgi:hypothetical protein